MTNEEETREPQANIHGNVDGAVLSGHFDGLVAVGGQILAAVSG